MKKLSFTILFIALLFSSISNAQVSQSFKIEDQTDVFTARFTVVPSSTEMDGSVGLSGKEVDAWGDFNCIVRFNSGIVDVRNGGNYAADEEVAFVGGKRYYIQLDVDVPQQLYSVKITPEGEEAIQIATDYAFRADFFNDSINFFATKIQSTELESTLGVSDFQIGSVFLSPDDNDNFMLPIDSINGDFAVTFIATPSASNMNGSVGLSKIPVSAWGDLNIIIRFNSDGFIDVRNGGDYSADSVVTYEGNKSYPIYVTGNTETSTYSVLVGTPETGLIKLATDYAFRQNNVGDTLNYLVQRVGHASTDIPGSYVAIDGINKGILKWENDEHPAMVQKMEPEAGTFTKEFVVTPTSENMATAIAFCDNDGVSWGDFSAIIRFDNGFIDARNSDTYTSDSTIAYVPGNTYKFKVDVDVVAQTYNVFVKTSIYDTEYITLAEDYGFRKTPVTSLEYMIVKTVSGYVAPQYLTIADVGVTLPATVQVLGNDTTLSSIKIDGEVIPDFVSTTASYTYELPGGTTDIPEVTAETTDTSATYQVTLPNELPGEATIVVTAENGDTMAYSVSFELATAINITNNDDIFSIYPNPVNSELNLSSTNNILEIRIFNEVGKTVKAIKEPMSTINVGELASGFYFIRVKTVDGNHSIKKFYKQ